jgi:hypothetical protein
VLKTSVISYRKDKKSFYRRIRFAVQTPKNFQVFLCYVKRLLALLKIKIKTPVLTQIRSLLFLLLSRTLELFEFVLKTPVTGKTSEEVFFRKDKVVTDSNSRTYKLRARSARSSRSRGNPGGSTKGFLLFYFFSC